jgi:hypothetical protein
MQTERTTSELAPPVFSSVTWADLPNGTLRRQSAPRSWEGLHALAVEAHRRTRGYCALTLDQWRVLIDGTAAGLPVTITARDRTAVYVVESIHSLADRCTSNIYVRTWGFNHPLGFADIVSVSVPASLPFTPAA